MFVLRRSGRLSLSRSLPVQRSSLSTQSSTPHTHRGRQIVSLLLLGGVAAAAAYAQTERAENLFGAHTVDMKKVREDLLQCIEAEDERRDDGTSVAPTLVRLAWHASGTFSSLTQTGGSGGATMRFSPERDWPANKGLHVARELLEPLKHKHGISYADLWTLAGVVAVQYMGGPNVLWRAGRRDAIDEKEKPALAGDLLPNADCGCAHASNAHIRSVFHRMGFTDREMVALVGAHAVGRCHEENSGYWGPWTYAESTFSNEYFRLLLEEQWREKKTHEGKPWTGPRQFETSDGKLMMLPSDLWMLEDPELRKYVEMYAKDEALFFRDFAAAFRKLLELGVDFNRK